LLVVREMEKRKRDEKDESSKNDDDLRPTKRLESEINILEALSSDIICLKDEFEECLVEIDGKRFQYYQVLKGTTIYHGTSCKITKEMILQKDNFFAGFEDAKRYEKKKVLEDGCGKLYSFRFKKKAILLRMDLCSNVKTLLKIALEKGRDDVILAINESFKCLKEEEGMRTPLRYSKSSEVDLVIAHFITEVGFDGFACKRQRAITANSWKRIKIRGKQLSKDAFFHAELYLNEPEKYLK
jgi:hypothetical protein